MNILSKANERIGMEGYNSYGSKMTIIKYKNADNITVRFENGYVSTCAYHNFTKGKIKNVYDKSVCNIGYIGEGEYKVKVNNKLTKVYVVWSSMIRRAYDDKYKERYKSYRRNCL